MRKSPDFKHAIHHAQEYLKNTGQIITTESWQGIHKPIEMFESFDYAFQVPMYGMQQMKHDISPNLPWADEHFLERVSGIPYNPPPSHERWLNGNTKDHLKEGDQFSHTYPERFWPKYAGAALEKVQWLKDNEYGSINVGIRYCLGDLDDVINLLYKEPHTRQAYLPIFFPEDTGAVDGQRVPCTLGYLFRMINGYLHITYKIRSCDFYRHFRDDIYLGVKLAYHVVNTLVELGKTTQQRYQWKHVSLGMFKMQIDSLHVFALEKDKL